MKRDSRVFAKAMLSAALWLTFASQGAYGSDLSITPSENRSPDGTAIYSYTVRNDTGLTIAGFNVGVDWVEGKPQLVKFPVGWTYENNVPSGTMTAPPGWESGYVIVTEEDDHHELAWEILEGGPGIRSGQTLGGFQVRVEAPDPSYLTSKYVVFFTNGTFEVGTLDYPVPGRVTLTPNEVVLTASQTAQFDAIVNDPANPAIQWTLTPNFGTISESGLYTAPSVVAEKTQVVVTATNSIDPTKKATAKLTVKRLEEDIAPLAAPTGPASGFSGTSYEFTTAATWSDLGHPVQYQYSWGDGTSSDWTPPGVRSSVHTWSVPGAYDVTVRARCANDTSIFAAFSLALRISVEGEPVTVAVSPVATTLRPGQTQQFVATVGNTSNTAVQWKIEPADGSITASGLYTAPGSLSTPQSVTVSATSVVDTSKIASATVSLIPPVQVTITPATATLTAGQTQQLTATVTNAGGAAVTWSLTPSVGTISATGLYTAPASVGVSTAVSVVATSSADPTKSAAASLTVNPALTVSVTPTTATVIAGQQRQFTAAVTGSSNTGVTWSVTPALGSISADGLYVPPASVASQQNVSIRATSVVNPARSAAATVTVAKGPVALALVSVNPSAASPTQAVSVLGSGFLSNNLAALTVVLAPQAGTPVQVPAGAQGTGSGRSINFFVPNDIIAGSYSLSVSGSGYTSNSVAFTVNPPPTFTLAPASGAAGTTVQVVLTPVHTSFPANMTTAKFGPGISVGGAAQDQFGPVAVQSNGTAVATLTIDAAAATGLRTVQVNAFGPLVNAFNVSQSAP